MSGWVKLHRKMLDNPVVWKSPDHVAVWTYLLLTATHKERSVLFGKKKVTLKPGQLITGRLKIAEATGVHPEKVRRVIEDFKQDGQVEQEGTRNGSLITITAWAEYQVEVDNKKEKPTNTSTNTTQSENRQPQGKQELSTGRATNTSTNRRPTGDHYTRMKECEEVFFNEGPEEKNGLTGMDLIRWRRANTARAFGKDYEKIRRNT